MLAIADRYAQHCKVALRKLCVSNDGVLKFDFDRRLMLQFRGSVVISNAGLLAYRELDEALAPFDAGEKITDDELSGGAQQDRSSPAC